MALSEIVPCIADKLQYIIGIPYQVFTTDIVHTLVVVDTSVCIFGVILVTFQESTITNHNIEYVDKIVLSHNTFEPLFDTIHDFGYTKSCSKLKYCLKKLKLQAKNLHWLRQQSNNDLIIHIKYIIIFDSNIMIKFYFSLFETI